MDSDEEYMGFDDSDNAVDSADEGMMAGEELGELQMGPSGDDGCCVRDPGRSDSFPSGSGRERCVSTSAMTKVEYSFLSPDEVCHFMNREIKEIQQVIQLPATLTRILLSHYHWDKEMLMERYYEDSEKLFEAASVMSPEKLAEMSRSSAPPSGFCEICMTTLKERVERADLKGNDCGHRFCSDCWKSYLTHKIISENCSVIECPAYKCKMLIANDDFVMEMLKGPATITARRKYQRGITNSFVEDHKNMRWCVGSDCMYAVRVSSADWVPVDCPHCHTTFCFLCGKQWHDPVTCDLLRKWEKKCADDSETCNWISANTKECPSCHATIEKDGGCNHVICKNSSCRGEFCWICLGPWQPHGSSWFKCNRYSDADSQAARDAQERSRAALQRYLFYFNRFSNHRQSLQLESKLKNSIRQKMEDMQQHNMSWIEVQFLQKAVDALQKCRQALLYTYVFAFYLEKGNQQIIFEENQHDLENATEVLSGYLERDVTGSNVTETKQKVQDKTAYCEMRRRKLLEHVHEGYENGWWSFRSDR